MVFENSVMARIVGHLDIKSCDLKTIVCNILVFGETLPTCFQTTGIEACPIHPTVGLISCHVVKQGLIDDFFFFQRGSTPLISLLVVTKLQQFKFQV